MLATGVLQQYYRCAAGVLIVVISNVIFAGTLQSANERAEKNVIVCYSLLHFRQLLFKTYLFLYLFIICPIAIPYHGTDYQISFFVCVCVCVCVCLWARLRSHFSTDLHEIW